MEIDEKSKKLLQRVVQDLKDNQSGSQKYLDCISDEKIKETALYQNFQITNKANKEYIEVLKEAFNLEIK